MSLTHRIRMSVEPDERAITVRLGCCRRPTCHCCGSGVEAFVGRSVEGVSGWVVVEKRRLDAHGQDRRRLDEIGKNVRTRERATNELRMECQKTLKTRVVGFWLCGGVELCLQGLYVGTATILSKNWPPRAACVTFLTNSPELEHEQRRRAVMTRCT